MHAMAKASCSGQGKVVVAMASLAKTCAKPMRGEKTQNECPWNFSNVFSHHCVIHFPLIGQRFHVYSSVYPRFSNTATKGPNFLVRPNSTKFFSMILVLFKKILEKVSPQNLFSIFFYDFSIIFPLNKLNKFFSVIKNSEIFTNASLMYFQPLCQFSGQYDKFWLF